MSTITVSRQLGSLGWEVATVVAARLGYRLVRREVVNQAARRAGVPIAALAEIDELGLLKLCPTPKECRAYHRAVRQVIEEFADAGNVVIVGRAGQVILGGRPDTLHVRVIAPVACRIERLVGRYHISSEAAAAQIKASDEYRRNYLKKFYRVRWDDPELYDVTLNTAQLSVEAGAELILAALAQPLPGRPIFQDHEPTPVS